MKDLYLIGAGGHCASCIDVIESTGIFNIRGVFDLPEKVGEKILGYTIIGSDEDISKYIQNNSSFLITIGQIKSASPRIKVFESLIKSGAELAIVVSPRAYVAPSAEVGLGTIVMHDALVNARARIGINSIINTKSLIEHDAEIGNHCHISTAAVVNGSARIMDKAFLGSNATVREKGLVSEAAVIPAGCFVRDRYDI
ncbi:NeuD/PglB/VioB family sugar acetyltransferase [Bdellovibrio sp. HCB-110]|uniref:NeuD/PglB/VioB family sugar acetyltransferase n=1 Tax=Bdellovibrio sp. HCB-110 TaxID=3391182 RepID=UPI0039B6A89C